MGTGITKYVLKHPVTTVMALLCLIVFGITSVFSAKLEQMPDMETPMLIVRAGYSGAGPEDICELVDVYKRQVPATAKRRTATTGIPRDSGCRMRPAGAGSIRTVPIR